MFYYPDRVEYFDPKRNGIAYNNEVIEVPGESLNSWYFPSVRQGPCQDHLIVHFHGNAQNLSSHFVQLLWTTGFGMDYIIFDYPGYGKSTGEANRQSIHQASLAVISQIHQKYPDKKVILYGQSLGGAVLLGTLSQLEDFGHIKAVVVEAGFLSYQQIAQRKLGQFWLTWPLQWLAYLLINDDYSAGQKLVSRNLPPIYILHGEKDRVVPIEESRQIFLSVPEPRYLWSVDQVGHLQVLAPSSGIREKLIEFLCEK